MQIRFVRPLHRWFFLAAALSLCVGIILPAVKMALAAHWDASPDSRNWLRAAHLEPGNADYWYHLGRYRHLDFENADPALAISYFRRALAIDSRSAYFWMDLAETYETSGDMGAAREAFQKAGVAYPRSAEVAWRYGNFLLRRGETQAAFREMRRAVDADRGLLTVAVSRAWHVSGDMERVLDAIVPAEADAYWKVLNQFVGERESAPALEVWTRIVASKETFELKRALPLLDQLIAQGRIGDARRVWRQALAGSHEEALAPVGPSIVCNGGFEYDAALGGFGWRLGNTAGASWDYDAGVAHSGKRSLRITFDGSTNLSYRSVLQIVPVVPGTPYHFTAFLRTARITTDSGLRFQIVDGRTRSGIAFSAPELTGNNPWTLEEAGFITGPHTDSVTIFLYRAPSAKFDNKLSGTVWVDDVSLAPAISEASRPSP